MASANRSLAEDAGPADREKIQGSWVAVSGEMGGKKVSEERTKACSVTFQGDTVHLKGLVRGEGKGKFSLDPGKKPKSIDIFIEDEEDTAAIYELDGDMLKICINAGGRERPKKFTTSADDRFILIVFKR
jgi:uncharacterized protein (TIGR03067 family)